MTLLSRLSGYVRDVVVANMFGASATIAADAFFIAFKIPNFFRRMFAEGAFSQAFVPILAEYKTQRSVSETQALIDRAAGALAAALIVLTVIGVLGAPLVISVFAPGFIGSDEKFLLAADMLRITFPYLLFISLTALAGAILNTYGRFAIPAITPVLLNLSLITAAIFIAPLMEQPVKALAWGVFAGGVLQLVFQFPFLRKLHLVPLPKFERRHPGVQRIVKLMLPAMFGASVSQLNLMLDTLIASFLVTGSISWLYYSDRLVEFPLGVFGIALATVILPTLSQRHAEGSPETFSRTLDWALRWVFVIGLPASAGLAVLAEPMLCTLFQYGRLTGYDVDMAGRSLMAYSFGLLGFTLVKVLAPGFFARQNTRTPVRVGIIAMVSNMVLNVVLVFPLAHAGLALATSIGAFINAGLLFRILRRDGVYHPRNGWVSLLTRVIVASVLMSSVLMLVVPTLPQWLVWGAFARMTNLTALVVFGAALYSASLWLFGLRWQHMSADSV